MISKIGSFPEKVAVLHSYRSLLRHLVQLECDIFDISGLLLEETLVPVGHCGDKKVVDGWITVRPGTSSSSFGFLLYRLYLLPTVTSFHGAKLGVISFDILDNAFLSV